jgi:hypothetical protein
VPQVDSPSRGGGCSNRLRVRGAGSISAEDLRAFQEWKTMAQAAAASPVQGDKKKE